MIITCPECGHKVSDKAPICPSCGVEIAGHIIKCSNCGEIYLKDEEKCPHCQHTERQIVPSQTEIPIENKLEELPKNNTNKHSHKSFFIIVAIAICSGLIILFFTKINTNYGVEIKENKTAQKSSNDKLNKKIPASNNADKYKAKIASNKEYLESNTSDKNLTKKVETTVYKEEKEEAIATLRQLLTGINNRNKTKIREVIAPQFSLQGVSESTAKDVFKYMNDKLYQADVKTIDWRLADSDKAIFTKKEDSSIQIKIPTKLIIDRKGGKGLKKYLVEATVNSGRITQISWK